MRFLLLVALLAASFVAPLFAQYDRPVRYFPTDPVNPCSVITPLVNNWVLGKLWECVGSSGVNNGTWTLISTSGTPGPPGPPGPSASGLQASTYSFCRSPGGTLTATVPASALLTPVPQGVNGSDTNHWYYLSGGTGIAEAVLGTGGSAVSGGSSGTISFTPANSHSGAWTLCTATAGVQEALNVGCAVASPFLVTTSGSITINATPSVQCSDASIVGPATWNLNIPASATGSGLNAIGAGSGATATTTTNLPFASRSTQALKTIGFSSVTGFAPGTLVRLFYDDGTYQFMQYNRIASIATLNVTFVDPIVVPLLTAAPNNISVWTMISNLTLRDIRMDCSGSNAAATQLRGMFLQNVENSQLDNVSFKNCFQSTGGTGLYMSGGYRNSLHNVKAYNSGSLNVDAISLDQQTLLTADGISAEGNPSFATTAFGIGLGHNYLGNFTNLSGNGNYSRQIKLGGSGWNRFANVSANDSVHATGLAITIGSYRNTFSNVTALNNTSDGANGVGLWFSGQNNEFNTFYNVQLRGNGNADYAFAATDTNNTIYGLSTGTYQDGTSAGAQVDPGSGNRIELAGGTVHNAVMGCSATATSSTTIVMLPATNAACTNAGASIQQVIVLAPAVGVVRNLRVSALTGGVNGSSGVVTVVIPTVGQTNVTCTLGTGTSCSDLSHYYVIAAGTRLQVNVTTQAGETLADILVSFEY